MSTDLEERVRALERALTRRDDPPSSIPTVADVSSDVDDLDVRVSTLESHVEDIGARQQAVEAYVDRIDHVNDHIERRADAALAAVDRLESTLQSDEPISRTSSPDTGSIEASARESLDHRRPGGSSYVGDASSISDESNDDAEESPDGFLTRVLGL